MRTIPLTKGCITIVDDEDFKFLSQWQWYAHNSQSSRSKLYAARRDGNQFLLMHRVLMSPPSNMQIDHINDSSLDNRRENLRVCHPWQNIVNIPKRKNCSSIYRGVSFCKQTKRWSAKINAASKKVWLERHNTEIEAALAYDKAASRLHGVFAQLNFPENENGKQVKEKENVRFRTSSIR